MYIRNILLIATFSLVLPSLTGAQVPATERRSFSNPEMAGLNLPFSDAVLVGDTLYLSGNGGIDLATMTAPEDPREEEGHARPGRHDAGRPRVSNDLLP
jgi:enamine deaminase RidA (YjgF/YER057c/UK114 family)